MGRGRERKRQIDGWADRQIGKQADWQTRLTDIDNIKNKKDSEALKTEETLHLRK